MMAIGAGLSFSTYTLVNKQIVQKVSSEMTVAVVFTLSAILLSPLLLIYDVSWALQLDGMLVVLQLGVVATAMAYLLFVKGLMGVPASTAVTLSLAEPLTAALLGILVVGEILTPSAILGLDFFLLEQMIVLY